MLEYLNFLIGFFSQLQVIIPLVVIAALSLIVWGAGDNYDTPRYMSQEIDDIVVNKLRKRVKNRRIP